METYSYLTFLTSTVDFLSLCQGFIARKKWLNSQHLQWGHHQTWSAAVKPVPPFCRQWLTGVWSFVSLGWAGNDEPPALPWGDLWRRCISERGGASPGDRGRASCEGDGELHSHTGTGWSQLCQGLGSAGPALCSVAAPALPKERNPCQKGFVSTDRSTEHSSHWQIAKSGWSSGLQMGLETPEFLLWLRPWFSAVTLNKSFELLWARFIALVIPFDRVNEEVYGPLYLHFPICKRGWMLSGCNYCPQVLRCFKSLQLFDVCKPICWYMEYLCGKKL